MSQILQLPPYGPRNDGLFLAEMNRLVSLHAAGCPAYARITGNVPQAREIAGLPYLHAGIFKHLLLTTVSPDSKPGRILLSSSTSGAQASQIQLDDFSSSLHQQSTRAILENFLGPLRCPLLVLDRGSTLRQRGVAARLAAAFSLQPLSTGMHFLLDETRDCIRLELLAKLLPSSDEFIVYGFTWMLWTAWASATFPPELLDLLRSKRLHFVHSGGWKRMEALRVTRDVFDTSLISLAGPGSNVVDYYGLVEQVGIIYPLCQAGFRHPPVWADVLVRDPLSHACLNGQPGQLQLMNVLAYGAPYHSVLTEDTGSIIPGPCPCGRSGSRFLLQGRLPNAELRGCANV